MSPQSTVLWVVTRERAGVVSVVHRVEADEGGLTSG